MQITTLLRLFENHELNRSLPMALDSAPTDGAPREFSTRMLQRALRDAGAQNRLTVAKPDGGDLAVAREQRWVEELVEVGRSGAFGQVVESDQAV